MKMNERLRRFATDEVMVEMVREALLSHYMKKREGNVQSKAAQMMAIEMLNEALDDIIKINNKTQKSPSRQIGL